MVNDLRAFREKVRRETGELVEMECGVRPAEFEATAPLCPVRESKFLPDGARSLGRRDPNPVGYGAGGDKPVPSP